MSNVTPAAPERFAAELVRRGLPVEYAQRAASELDDHRRDLISELLATGVDEQVAPAEAVRRLGDARTLVKKTVGEYQRRYWCARWPLLTFLVAPIPVLIASWYAVAIALWFVVSLFIELGMITAVDADLAVATLPPDLKYACLVGVFLVIPAGVIVLFAWLARRAALGGRWLLLVACLVGLFVGSFKWERIGPGSMITMRDPQTLEVLEQPHQPDFVVMMGFPLHSAALSDLKRFWLANPVQIAQLLLPAGVAGALLLRARQLAQRRQQLVLGGC